MPLIERVTAVVLLAGLLSLIWMVLRATNVIPGPPSPREVLLVTIVWAVLFTLVSVVGLYSTRRQ
jgi:hypothetical protein